MNIGDRIKFSFAGEEKEGMVVKIFPKKVYLKVDFPKHPGKTIMRSLADLEGSVSASKKSKKKEKVKKEKKVKKEPTQGSKEKKEEESGK